MTDLIAILAERVRAVREETGLSQEEYAMRIGVHRTYLGSIERGVRNPSLRAVMRLAEKMGVPTERLLR